MSSDEVVKLIEAYSDSLSEDVTTEEWAEVCEDLAANFEVKAEAARFELEGE